VPTAGRRPPGPTAVPRLGREPLDHLELLGPGAFTPVPHRGHPFGPRFATRRRACAHARYLQISAHGRSSSRVGGCWFQEDRATQRRRLDCSAAARPQRSHVLRGDPSRRVYVCARASRGDRPDLNRRCGDHDPECLPLHHDHACRTSATVRSTAGGCPGSTSSPSPSRDRMQPLPRGRPAVSPLCPFPARSTQLQRIDAEALSYRARFGRGLVGAARPPFGPGSTSYVEGCWSPVSHMCVTETAWVNRHCIAATKLTLHVRPFSLWRGLIVGLAFVQVEHHLSSSGTKKGDPCGSPSLRSLYALVLSACTSERGQ
jgi:hypothetical protein